MPDDDSATAASAVAPPVAGEEPRLVLLVEDEPAVLQVTSAMLRALGFRIVSAASGDAAIPLLESEPAICLLLTDVMLPGALNGPALAQRARAIRPGLPILFVSGYAEVGIIEKGILGAGMELLQKPFRRQELRARIEKVLGGGAAPTG
jgi:CheY-like chemotaxis protein